jgi:Fusaric acid resistance protein-like
MSRPGARYIEALMVRYGLSQEHLVGVRFAINIALATTIVWQTLRAIGNDNPIWAIASMVVASDPHPEAASRMFKARLINVAVGCAIGFAFLVVGGAQDWILPLAMAVAVLVSSFVVRIKTEWRQAPINAAVVIAAAVMDGSSAVVTLQGLRKVAAVVFGSVVAMVVSLAMSKVWLIPLPTEDKTGDRFMRSMLRPIPPAGIFQMLQTGWSAQMLLGIGVGSINGLRNSLRGSAADPRFDQLVAAVSRLQRAGV